MFEKSNLKKKIKECKQNIEDLEKKRARSEAALVTALLNGSVPNDDDVEYFNSFTSKIDEERTRMQEYKRLLDQL